MIHSYSIQTKDYLHMDLYASSLGQRSQKHKGSILWNSLPDEFKSVTSITSFVDKIKTVLLYMNINADVCYIIIACLLYNYRIFTC